MTTTIATIATTTTCEARTGRRLVNRDGFPADEPVRCERTVGIRSYVASDGTVHAYCGLPEHKASVEWQAPPAGWVAASCTPLPAGPAGDRPSPGWTALDMGNALLDLLAIVPAGAHGPSIVRETDGWRVTVTLLGGRRFRTPVEAIRRNPVDALGAVADRLRAMA